MSAPILSPAFKWTPAKDHLTPQGLDDFRARMRARIAAAQKPNNVKQLRKGAK
jgi:hypothetical protein